MRPEEMVGQTLGHYRILRPLGHGGTATVFLAQDIHLQRDVAVKVFLPREGDTQEFLRRFAREARVLAQLDHPNILPVYEYGEEGALAFLVMPHMAGGSLRDRVRKGNIISPRETVQLISQILNALQYAHERNLIHRDIKPGNMLFKADETLMLSDFGLVKVLAGEAGTSSLLSDSASLTKELTGTPDYMAPEQIQGKVVPASDIYAIGVVLYEMLTGTHLFDSDNYIGVLVKHMYEQPRPLREINPQISPELEFVVLQALHKDPAQRYQHPTDLRQALLEAIREDAPPAIHRSTETTKTAPSAPLSSMTGIGNSLEHTQTSPMHLHSPQSTPVTPSSPTHSDAHPATRIPRPGQAIPGPTSYPAPPSYASLAPVSTQRSRSIRPLVTALILIILVLIAGLSGVLYAQGHMPPPLATRTPQPNSSTPGISPVTKGNTVPFAGNTEPVPPTQIDCPAPGQARAAIIAPLMLGNQPNVVYIVNEGLPENPTGTIKRRVANFQAISGIEIRKMAATYVSEAQVSQDGQWVLFVAKTHGQSELRMVRVDGQGLQTLYCAPAGETISNSQWSFDQRTVVFNVSPGNGMPTMYLLDITTGNAQVELTSRSTLVYTPRTWLDNTHIYITGFMPNSGGGSQNLYILDIKNGANQHDNNLQKIVSGLPVCGSFDSSYDSSQLLISSCQLTPSAGGGQGVFSGPTNITSEAATGGPTKTIQTLQHAVTMLRAVSPTTLLLLVENTDGDTGQNGLWKMNTDGTGLTQLSSDKSNAQSLCQFSQYAWSNVSPDGSMYAFQEIIPNGDKTTYNLYYGFMNSGKPYEFANIIGTQLLLAGWTRL